MVPVHEEKIVIHNMILSKHHDVMYKKLTFNPEN